MIHWAVARTRSYTKRDERSAAKRLADGWVNTTSGLGTARDKTTNVAFIGDCRQSEPELEELYRFNAFARVIVSELPKEALRLGVEMKVASDDDEPQESDQKKEKALAKIFRTHQAVPKMLLARVWGRLYGRGAVVFSVKGGGAPETPWEPGKGTVSEIFVATGRELRVKSYYSDPMSAKFSTPATYWLTRYSMGAGAAQVEVHESRMLVFGGADTPPHAKAENQGSDDSVLVAAYESLKQEGSNWASVSSMIGDLSVAVYKLQDYIDSLSGKGATVINQRLAEMDAQKGVFRCLVVDKDGEDFEFKERGAATGLADLLDKGLLRVAAVSRMPVTKLLGQSPAGLNATGESDQTNWYDAANVERTTHFDDPFRRLAQALDPSAEWETCWPSLWQETDKEKLERLNLQADVDKKYIDAGVLQPEEVALARFDAGSELGIEVDMEVREELLENATEELLNPPEPVPGALPGALPGAPAAPGAKPPAVPAPKDDYDPDQPRAENGQFGEGGGGSDVAPRERIASVRASFKSEVAASVDKVKTTRKVEHEEEHKKLLAQRDEERKTFEAETRASIEEANRAETARAKAKGEEPDHADVEATLKSELRDYDRDTKELARELRLAQKEELSDEVQRVKEFHRGELDSDIEYLEESHAEEQELLSDESLTAEERTEQLAELRREREETLAEARRERAAQALSFKEDGQAQRP